MNPTSLYVSTCRLIISADANDKSSWSDLFRVLPYLRQSLSCIVCGNLLKEPYTPNLGCQHHVCKNCIQWRKKIKPPCSWCADCEDYTENIQLRILLQCYNKLCEYFMATDMYNSLLEEDEVEMNGGTVASSGLIFLIQEGAGFFDDYRSKAGLPQSAYSKLPCAFTNIPTTQTQVASTSSSENNTTVTRKDVNETSSPPAETNIRESQAKKKYIQWDHKKPSYGSRTSANKKKGCRCGYSSPAPGILTCCGQRCLCYVQRKPCTECKCKGCRNPHRTGLTKGGFHKAGTSAEGPSGNGGGLAAH
ncbi:E3 ubiquitin-protein ligase MSL2 [Bicyclus anynana]|uniref:E3 ubiquitin-protein ligase MSL2 n=1 Tax=Bicyclus anynana TaxID=110368 RepID=A0A6J1MTF7_BICAN|nr:E3 ubiquitin-protein ligase MSL2 [Bicyclus anynana]